MSRMNESTGTQGGGQGGQEQGGTAGQLRDTATQVGQQLRDAGQQAMGAAREKFDDLRNQASEYYDQGRQRAQEWEQNLETYITDQPIKAMLMAAGVGFLLGVIWKRS